MRADSDATLLLRMRLAAQPRPRGRASPRCATLATDATSALPLRDWFRSGQELGPEIVAAGPPITVTGGHCHFMGGEADGELEVRRAVRERVKAGADVIKLMATGGHMTPGHQSRASRSTPWPRCARRSRRRIGSDRLLTAHAHGPLGIAVAVEAGVDGIEHCSFRVASGRQPDPRLVERIAEQRIAVCPTVGTVPSGESAPASALTESFLPILAHMHEVGVRLVGGTDAGISPAKPHDALALWRRVPGASGPLGGRGADRRHFRRGRGVRSRRPQRRVAPGKDADLLVVDGNPLEDLRPCYESKPSIARAEDLPVYHPGVLLELRQYRTKPGQRENWVRYMHEQILPFQTATGHEDPRHVHR